MQDESSLYCPYCKARRRCLRRPAITWVDWIIALLTAGLWMLVMLAKIAVVPMIEPWRCSTCGTKV